MAELEDEGNGALADLRVVDLSQVLAGPFSTMLMADLGADVVKVEAPGVGDLSRKMHPVLPQGTSGAFLTVNRNKRSLSIDLKSREGLDILRGLVRTADVLVENFRPGVTRRLGIDYDTLAGVNPRLIYCSISGFGQSGPYASRGGFDLIAQGMSGIMSITGAPGGEPVKCGVPVTDLAAGLFAVYGVLAALRARDQSGRGQQVDTSLFEAGLGLTVWEATEHFYTGGRPQPTGSAHRLSSPYQAFRTSDGFVTVGADGERHWPLFCQMLDLPEMATDPRFATNAARLQNAEALTTSIEGRTVQRPSAYWLQECEARGIPAGPINGIPEALSDPHALARGMIQVVEHPVAGSTRTLGPVVKFSATPASIRRPAPALGEHTDEILSELGLNEHEVAELHRRGVVA